MRKNFIITRLQFEGLHCWPGCPADHECSFLASKHRHMFFCTCKKIVESSLDREIEIIQFKHQILDWLRSKFGCKDQMIDLGSCSCEQLANDLADQFKLAYCEVLEDNENGGGCTTYENMVW